VFRVFVTLQAQQIDYFAEVGSELELIYRQIWYEPGQAIGQQLRTLPTAPSSSSEIATTRVTTEDS
jgi:biopolymer transport protein ExbB